MRFKYAITIIALAATLSACAETGQQKQQAGSVVGGVLGGVLGSNVGSGKGKTAGTIIGVLLGAVMGGEIGKSMDKVDRMYAERTTQKALETEPSGQTSTWSNPDSGHSGSVTPIRTYRNDAGVNCREFETTVYIGGKEETATGTACRQSDGTWKIQQ
ncbi:RT0821/Lpp0805 family surface protein [Varunaivibrio sulfuroxidans]|uniref:17 kDa surface antigen n=1 Tax=Varunaivibrio sulfuroxidans TaxID=1773489 RepID=A0A4V2UN41_9PROT|nr:RT0821/Lpp0805 family surface protein [Varunaivibrio sulfuroxidans]TCS60341.1 surface antigen [Varunaivibrio sulfuroxidans]WES30972.1 RT0821/Lpp0805 family surface protein [Varunaivibrio sulfuroxidans]